MKAQYEGILGVVVNKTDSRKLPITALFIRHADLEINEDEIGFHINNNAEPNIQLIGKRIEDLEELINEYEVSGRCDTIDDLQAVLDNLYWLGYAYIMKNYRNDLPGEPPLLVISSPQIVDLNIWKEISNTEFIHEINERMVNFE